MKTNNKLVISKICKIVYNYSITQQEIILNKCKVVHTLRDLENVKYIIYFYYYYYL